MQINVSLIDNVAMINTKHHWNNIAKPLNSLGKLEDIVVKLSGIFGEKIPKLHKKCVVVMCADNGVVAEGISQSGQEITAIVAENMTNNSATINHLCAHANSDVIVVDIGMSNDVCNSKILDKKIMRGTKNFAVEPAMTREQALKAIETGAELVKKLKSDGYKMIATGEMGIGNTCSSSAVTSCLLNKSPSLVTGKGAGLTTAALAKKIEVIERAIAVNSPNPKDPLDVLCKVGGLDIAGLTGVFLGGAIQGLPILIDGFISSVAALLAVKLCPESKHFMFATHVSKEPAAKLVLEALDLATMLDLNMCLGEGTGAVLAFPIFDMAISVYKNMSTFAQAKIDTYKPLI